jgi:hypothetical protein
MNTTKTYNKPDNKPNNTLNKKIDGKLESWLKKRTTVTHTNNYKSKFDLDDNKGIYYSDNDIDIILNKKGTTNNTNQYIDTYMGSDVAIMAESKHSNCNYLYKSLVDIMSKETFMLPYVNKTDGFANMYLEVGMDLNKSDLYNYLFDNSTN